MLFTYFLLPSFLPSLFTPSFLVPGHEVDRRRHRLFSFLSTTLYRYDVLHRPLLVGWIFIRRGVHVIKSFWRQDEKRRKIFTSSTLLFSSITIYLSIFKYYIFNTPLFFTPYRRRERIRFEKEQTANMAAPQKPFDPEKAENLEDVRCESHHI